ncbi:SAM-dependent methyltransferase [Paenalcaligenes niemegkensis]|uniref:SAM-dependent methyltransferase n=1 Tax=Paenalcaligenes niemegkensis TaxID=2895469 RepID=UPI001EE9354C|nr:SAM-dependent methyltransferase [Paenalcaligenes niemegkensis]MCQ9616894.1 SAM-dependent methyltransferase [Paenalcaligenes niemegkensis]
MSTTAYLHLIPVSLGEADLGLWLPASVQAKAQSLDTYIAENAKTARAFLKQTGTLKPLQEITIHTLDKQGTAPQKIREWLSPIRDGGEIGLVSEAGCPAVADPGAAVVAIAHELNIQVMPHVGPSSILLSLMASGLDGQQFAFHGYPPVKDPERSKTLKEWEAHSKKQRQTQIFIETPYRNSAIFAALLQNLNKNTKLCVARSLTTADQWVRTLSVDQWIKQPAPELSKQPTIFLFQA